MANADAPFGARPIRRHGGGGIHLNRYFANVCDALYIGDIVALEGTADTLGVPSVIACTPSLIPLGIIVGMEVSADILDTQLHKKAGDSVYFFVADESDLIFEIQSDAATVAANFGLNADLVFGEGSVDTGRSKMELDHSTLATTAALHMHLMRPAFQPDNKLGADNVVECSWSQHAFGNSEMAGV